MKASTKRVLSLLVSAALLIMAIVVYIQYVKPEYNSIQLLRATREAKVQYYKDQATAILAINDLLAQQQNKKTLRDDIALHLPPKENVADIMGQLQAISQETGLLIQAVGLEYLPITKDKSASFLKGLGTLRLNVKLFGSYEAFKQFLAGLETNIRIMDVVDLKINGAGKPEQNLQSYNLVVDTYYQTN